jgi:hypothetical protein
MHKKTSRPVRAYLVRCWQEGQSTTDGRHVWRFSAEEVLHERRQIGFSNLEALVAFLRAELADGEDEPAGGGDESDLS